MWKKDRRKESKEERNKRGKEERKKNQGTKVGGRIERRTVGRK